MRALLTGGLLLLVLLARAADGPDARTEDLSWGQVSITLRAEPAEVRVDRDLLVTLTVETPASLQAELPELRDRFTGFAVAEGYASEPRTAGGRRTRTYHWRLTPALARDYRLAPFAVQVLDRSVGEPQRTSFATRPVLFAAQAPDAAAPGDVEVDPRPHWIPPTRRAVLGWIGLALLGAAALFGLARLLRLARRQARLRRLSPRERAFVELEELLHRRLVEKGLFKDFYIELTQVVRRYIERAHGIRAPEQTTEEFLAAASRHPHFTPEVLARLRGFLQSADLVKFAGQEASPALADRAVQTARDYVTTDAVQPATPADSTLTTPP